MKFLTFAIDFNEFTFNYIPHADDIQRSQLFLRQRQFPLPHNTPGINMKHDKTYGQTFPININ